MSELNIQAQISNQLQITVQLNVVQLPAEGSDMLSSIYDPQNVHSDAFDRSHHTGTQDISTITSLSEVLQDLESRLHNIEDGGAVPVNTEYVRITTTGDSFAPKLELVSGSTASVDWEVEEEGSSYTGITPTMNFGTVAIRHVRLYVAKSGINALEDIVTFNIGFNNSEDSSSRTQYSVGASYNYLTRQLVSGIEYVNKMTGLLRFLGATSTLTGTLDFTDMAQLQFIECYGANLADITLTGCSSLIRLCMENNDLATIDLTPVAGSLYDLRGSGNRSPIIIITDGAIFTNLFHWCTQSETVIGHATSAQLPAIEEWWDWNSGQTGALVIRSSAIRSVQSYNNGWTSVDIANQFPVDRNGAINLSSCNITAVNITNCPGINNLDLSSNQLSTATIDSILAEVDSWGTSNHILNLSDNAAPSSSTVVDILRGRGWTISHDTIPEPIVDKTTLLSTIDTATSNSNIAISIDGSEVATTIQWVTQAASDTYNTAISSAQTVYDNTSATQSDVDTAIITLNNATLVFNSAKAYGTKVPSVILWEDKFERADCTGIANVGNGWYDSAATVVTDANIVSNSIVTAWGDGYGRLLNTANGILPADYTVSTILPVGAKGHFFGLVGRWSGGTGVRLLFTDSETTMTIGTANSWSAGAVTLSTVTYPPTWINNEITHTMAMQMVGTAITIILDGVVAVTCNVAANSTATGTSVGFCGEGHNRTRSEITVTSIA